MPRIPMTTTPTIENRLYEQYLKYFHNAEEHRRWNLVQDIPWTTAKRHTDESIALIVESFMAVEMYLPDYTSKLLHLVRSSRGRAWFQANWGYEESKHSLALEMWLMKSGAKTEEEMREFQEDVLASEWRLPYDMPLEMILYTCFQEVATALDYRRLKRQEEASHVPGLQQVLTLLSRDEVGHFEFFKNGAKLFLEQDRGRVLDGLNVVIKTFQMPAQALIPGWKEND